MFPLLVEGLESAFFPCTLVILIPGVAVTLASRYFSTLAIFGFTVGLTLIAWFRFSERMGNWSSFTIAITILIASLSAISMLIASLLFIRPITDRLDLISTGAGALVGGAAAALWRPCVGAEFGSLLSQLPNQGSSGLALMSAYIVGLLAPLFIIGSLFYLVPDGLQEVAEPALAFVGSFVLLALALLIGGGFHDGVISWLFQLSSV